MLNIKTKMEKEIKYKGKVIKVIKPSGMFEYYSDKQKRFLKFDDLSAAKASIDKEKSVNETVKKKITLNELREVVKQLVRESEEDYNIIDLKADLNDGVNYAFGINKINGNINVFTNYGSSARISGYYKDKFNLNPAQVQGNFSVIHSGDSIDINKIPKKYQKFKII